MFAVVQPDPQADRLGWRAIGAAELDPQVMFEEGSVGLAGQVDHWMNGINDGVGLSLTFKILMNFGSDGSKVRPFRCLMCDECVSGSYTIMLTLRKILGLLLIFAIPMSGYSQNLTGRSGKVLASGAPLMLSEAYTEANRTPNLKFAQATLTQTNDVPTTLVSTNGLGTGTIIPDSIKPAMSRHP